MKKSDFFQSKYLKAADLEGGEMVLTISNIHRESIKDQDGRTEDKPVLYFSNCLQALILNLTNFNIIESLYGEETSDWRGKRVTLYPTTVEFKGKLTPAIRIRNMEPGAAKPSATAAADEGEQEDQDAALFWREVKALGTSKDDALPLARQAAGGEITWQQATDRLSMPF